MSAGGGLSAAGKWWGSTRGLVHTRRWPHLAPRRPDAAWPRTPAAWATAAGDTSAAGHGMADGGVQEGWRGERNMMALSAWKEEGLSSGDEARPTLAMAAMAARVREQQRGEGARERVTESEREGRQTRPPCCRPRPATPGRSRRVAATRWQRPAAGRVTVAI